MERIRRFLLDETATAEATSTVVMIAGAGILLAAALTVWYTGMTNIFTDYGTKLQGWAGSFNPRLSLRNRRVGGGRSEGLPQIRHVIGTLSMTQCLKN